MSFTLRKLTSTLVLTLLCCTEIAQAKDYDVVILNGRVMDPETMMDAVRNVGVKGGKIAAITTEKIRGKETINAKGHVVAPGFIDTHSHTVVTEIGQKIHLRDGVTTALELEAGVYPVGLWYDSWKGRGQVNYGATASFIGARETVFNPDYETRDGANVNDILLPSGTHLNFSWSTQVANDEEIETILGLYEQGLKEGALGVGNTAGYMPTGLTTREVDGAMALVGKYGGVMAMHGRYSSQKPPTSGLLGTSEAIAAAAAHDGALIVQHMAAQCLALTPDCQALIDAAYHRGTQVIAEIYVYTYGASVVGAPYLKPENYQRNMGHTYKDITNQLTNEPLTKESYEQLMKEAPNTPIMFENATKEDMYVALAHPTAIIASDAMQYSNKSDGKLARVWDTPYDQMNGHPRAAGTHAKVLRLVREDDLMPLMLAVSKMTFMPAKFLADNGIHQMAAKGRMQVGMDADITIFDPDKVTDNSTNKDGALPSTGIPYVIVNGTVVVKDSKVLKGVYPGQPIRNAVLN
ncbi:MAG: amidohydrolase family protein [Gammaproteobacteria bacterium]|nr:amidohydrolase family protein [Gammaproteobacteria bacterium]